MKVRCLQLMAIFCSGSLSYPKLIFVHNIVTLYCVLAPQRGMAWRSHGRDNDDLVTQLKGIGSLFITSGY